jgi:L-alanine-DL-glutamate epimerase-like enolase superfamily enzyme
VGLATPIAETSLGTAAALHLAAVLPQVEWALGPSADYLADDIVDEPIRHRQGSLAVPIGPGLGVTIDPLAVERLRLDR